VLWWQGSVLLEITFKAFEDDEQVRCRNRRRAEGIVNVSQQRLGMVMC
jgi:hypothetical protein